MKSTYKAISKDVHMQNLVGSMPARSYTSFYHLLPPYTVLHALLWPPQTVAWNAQNEKNTWLQNQHPPIIENIYLILKRVAMSIL